MLNLITSVPRSSDTDPGAVRRVDPHAQDAWKLLSWLGAIFALLGIADIALGVTTIAVRARGPSPGWAETRVSRGSGPRIHDHQ